MKILYLTNLQNDGHEEDKYLIEVLRKDFEIIVSHPLECEKYLALAQGIIIRNIWPTHEYADEWKRIKKAIMDSGLKTYNPLTGKGDILGKDYLVDLYKKGYPVIPSIDRIEDLDSLPESEWYWIKPKEGADGYHSMKVARKDLPVRLDNHILQPYVEFTSEPSFYYIDNVFSYAISMPNRLVGEGIMSYDPTKEDLVFAQKFIEWNDMAYGIQRVDAVRNKSGELLLTEVEDIAEYLYFLDLSEDARRFIVDSIIGSIKKYFHK